MGNFIYLGVETFHIDDIKAFKFFKDHKWCPYADGASRASEAKWVLLTNGMEYDVETNKWTDTFELAPEVEPALPPYKYDEARLLQEYNDYVAGTYGQHYVGEDNVQSLDLIFSTGHGEGFCKGNILKYGARSGKKAGQERADLLKVMHYAMLGIYWIDKQEAKKKV